MAITVYETCNKRKRSPNIFATSNFPSSKQSSSLEFRASFRDNIKQFLKRCAEIEDYSLGVNSVWCALLVSESSGVVFPLYIIEENVKDCSPSQPFCDLCRFVGWSHHFVSKRNYHFIIPEGRKWNKPLKKESLKLQTHLLHGVIHCNGFGHLLCIKTKENSSYLQGEELMCLWENLCEILQTRDTSVHDVSKEGVMDLRLLSGVAYGRSWFGKWGYKLYRGSFGVEKQQYQRAIEILCSIELTKIIHDFSAKRQGILIEQIITTYRDVNGTPLVTISDLLQVMLSFESKSPIRRKTTVALASILSESLTDEKHEAETPNIHSNPSDKRSLASFVAKLDTRWPARRLETVVKAVCLILETNGSRMLRQDLRDSVREQIGDTGLIDCVLKNIDKVVVGNKIIQRGTNSSRLLEFSLANVSDSAIDERKVESQSNCTLSLQPGLDVYKDLLYLYKNVLLGYPDYHAISRAAYVVLDSKHLVKERQLKNGNNEDTALRLICQVSPSFDELVNDLTRPLPPGEIVTAQESTKVSELKMIVQYALRDTYCIMENFVAKDIQIGELVTKEDQDLVECGVKQGMNVWVRGCGLDLSTKMRYQSGDNDWTVDCKCGTKDDDGERMVACDVCHVWQHTRCNSIKDDDAPPPQFLCRSCSSKMNMLAVACNSTKDHN